MPPRNSGSFLLESQQNFILIQKVMSLCGFYKVSLLACVRFFLWFLNHIYSLSKLLKNIHMPAFLVRDPGSKKTWSLMPRSLDVRKQIFFSPSNIHWGPVTCLVLYYKWTGSNKNWRRIVSVVFRNTWEGYLSLNWARWSVEQILKMTRS